MPKGKIAPEQVEKMKQMKKEGKSVRKIAMELGVSPRVVHYYTKEKEKLSKYEWVKKMRKKQGVSQRRKWMEKRLPLYIKILEHLASKGVVHEQTLKRKIKTMLENEEIKVKTKPAKLINHLEDAGLIARDQKFLSLTERGKEIAMNHDKLKEHLHRYLVEKQD